MELSAQASCSCPGPTCPAWCNYIAPEAQGWCEKNQPKANRARCYKWQIDLCISKNCGK